MNFSILNINKWSQKIKCSLKSVLQNKLRWGHLCENMSCRVKWWLGFLMMLSAIIVRLLQVNVFHWVKLGVNYFFMLPFDSFLVVYIVVWVFWLVVLYLINGGHPDIWGKVFTVNFFQWHIFFTSTLRILLLEAVSMFSPRQQTNIYALNLSYLYRLSTV